MSIDPYSGTGRAEDTPRPARFLTDQYFSSTLESWEEKRCQGFRVLGGHLRAAGQLTDELWSDWPGYERHPLCHAVMNLIERQIEGSLRGDFEAELNRAIRKLSTIPNGWRRRAPRNLVVEQNPALLPDEFLLDPNVELSLCEPIRALQEAIDKTVDIISFISKNTADFIVESLKVVTFLDVKKDGAYFSGSGWDLFGAAHISSNLHTDALGEMLVHESEHARLHLLEIKQPILDESCDGRSCFYSPWRTDQRPIYGILHGVHVFSNVAVFLGQYLDKGPTERRPLVTQRLALVHAQVRRGVEELQMHANLTSVGEAVVEQAVNRLDEVENNIAPRDIIVAADTVTRVERERRNAWKIP